MVRKCMYTLAPITTGIAILFSFLAVAFAIASKADAIDTNCREIKQVRSDLVLVLEDFHQESLKYAKTQNEILKVNAIYKKQISRLGKTDC